MEIAGTYYPVQALDVTYPVNTWASAQLAVAPSKRKTTEFKFDMSQVMDELATLKSYILDRNKLATGWVWKKNLTTQETQQVMVLAGYVSSVSISADLGGFGLAVSLISNGIDMTAGSTKHLLRASQIYAGVSAYGSIKTDKNVFKAFLTFCEYISSHSIINEGVNPIEKYIKEDIQLAYAKLNSIVYKYTTFKGNINAVFEYSKLPAFFAQVVYQQCFNFGDALMAIIPQLQLQFASYPDKSSTGTLIHEVMADMSATAPFNEDGYVNTLNLQSIENITFSMLAKEAIQGVIMYPTTETIMPGMDNYSQNPETARPRSFVGSYMPPKARGKFVEIQQPWYTVGSLPTSINSTTINTSSTGTSASGGDTINNIPTPNNCTDSKVGVALKAPAPNPKNDEYYKALKKWTDGYCEVYYNMLHFENNRAPFVGELNLNARPGRCHNIVYVDPNGNTPPKLIGYLRGVRHSVRIDPQPEARTTYDFTHLRTEGETTWTADDMPNYSK